MAARGLRFEHVAAFALLLASCGQVLGLKDFEDAPPGGEGGNASGEGGSSATGGKSTSSGGETTDGSGGKADTGSGGEAPGGAGGDVGTGGAPGGAGGEAGSPNTGGTNVGGTTSGGSGGMGTTGGSTGSMLVCAPDGQAIDVFGPPELDVGTQQSGQIGIDEETLVVVADSQRFHVGIQRSDGQYAVRSLGDGSNGTPQPLFWTKVAGDSHRFTRGRVRAGKLEFYGQVQDAIAILQVPLGANGIAPGAGNSAVVETLGRRPCPTGSYPSNFATSFYGNAYSVAATCENGTDTARSIVIYESASDILTQVASGTVTDANLRVQGYVYVPGTPILQVGDGGSATLRPVSFMPGVTPEPFDLDFGTGLSAMFGITENSDQTGAQILAASLKNPGLVPARLMWASVPAEKYPMLPAKPPEGFAEMGVFRAVAEVGEPGRPSSGEWGTWMIGHSKTDGSDTSPAKLRGTWIGPQGAPLVFNQTLLTAQGPEQYRRGYAVRLGIAGTQVVWLELVPDPATPQDPTPKLHRVRTQRFVCSNAP